ncbi:lipase family protein [Marinimicrobium sp. LS-A18]|uniref:lipase family protein n=1 Tax=Marinimicrobium sp. LS-A18 TaxID=1381596 RepID=UPI000463EB78|nr:lipase family protein [Marinimicrobium sp. LS-A18]
MAVGPSDAALLAKRIYDVQNPMFVDTFLKLPPFRRTGSKRLSAHLKAEVGGRVLLNHKDGFGICSEGGDLYKNEVFLVFRGTTKENKGADFLTDARIGITNNQAGLPVHCGFHHCFASMLPALKAFFASLGGNIKVVHCVGHSLGGAVASLAADWVARHLKYATRLYTFGAPRVGTDWFVKSTTSAVQGVNMHRIYHKTDPVAMVPLYPFMHAPYNFPGHYIHSHEPLLSGDAHRMDRYVTSVKGKSWDSIKGNPEPPYTLESAIESWLESKTPVYSSSPTFWRWFDSALIYVIKKVAMATLVTFQGAFVGIFTVADKMAYLLAKGIKMAEHVGYWVERLMRKIMQALGMRAPESRESLTEGLIRHVLRRLMAQSNKDARNAIQKSDS